MLTYVYDAVLIIQFSLYITAAILCCACIWEYIRSITRTVHPFARLNIIIVNTAAESRAATRNLLESACKLRVMGFDCEWVDRNKISLLQLSTADGLCVLYRLCKLGSIPEEVQSLLEDPEVLKVGVAPVEDANFLLKDYDVFVRGCLDLRHLVENPEDARGLAKLTQNFLGVELVKDRYVRCSDWEAEELSALQGNYAARDALAAVKIFFKLVEKKLSGSILRTVRYRLASPRWEDYLNECEMYIDVRYSYGIKAKERGRVKAAARGDKLPRYAIMKRALYDNCWILAPDGAKLSTCNKRKVDWYVSNNLGEIVSENPTLLRLLFEPSTRGFDDNWRYNAQDKVNQCVVCASTVDLVRKNVVPIDYRRHFPFPMTDHSTHDILLLCVTCHRRSNISDMAIRHRLQRVTFDGKPHSANAEGEMQWIHKPNVQSVKNAAHAIDKFRDTIPADRLRHLSKVVTDYFNCAEVTGEVLEDAARLEAYELNEAFKKHGRDVVEKFEAGPGLEQLQKIWREHFVLTMKPKYLPPLWSVDHSHNSDGSKEMENKNLETRCD